MWTCLAQNSWAVDYPILAFLQSSLHPSLLSPKQDHVSYFCLHSVLYLNTLNTKKPDQAPLKIDCMQLISNPASLGHELSMLTTITVQVQLILATRWSGVILATKKTCILVFDSETLTNENFCRMFIWDGPRQLQFLPAQFLPPPLFPLKSFYNPLQLQLKHCSMCVAIRSGAF